MKYIMLIVAILLTGCYTEKKATKQQNKIASEHPIVLAKACTLYFPVQAKDSVHTEYIKGDVQYLPGDTIVKRDTITGIKTVTVNTIQHRVDTVYVNRTRVETDSAKLFILDQSISALTADKNKAEDKAKGYKHTRNILWIIIGSVSALVILKVVLSIYKKIP